MIKNNNRNSQDSTDLIKLNVIFAIALEIVTAVCGFIVPKIILLFFGSESNGLINSLSNFLGFISLLEGGVTGVISASLYKPLRESDNKKINGILNAAKKFYRKIGVIFVAGVFGVAIVYPLIVKTDFSYWYVAVLTVVLGLHFIIEYFLSLHMQVLIKASRRVYIVSLTSITIKLLNLIVVYITAHVFSDILILKFISALVYIVQPLIYYYYVKKHFVIDKTVPPDETALSQRWAGFGQNIAYYVNTNTDVYVLTLLSTLTNVSIYSVYFLFAKALSNLVAAFSSALTPSLGNIMAGDDHEEKERAFDVYTYTMYFLASLFFTCGIILVTSFVNIYTSDLPDHLLYDQKSFGILIMTAQLMYCFREPYLSLAFVTNHFKDTAKYAYAEAILNIIVSVTLVSFFGLVGVAIGTVCAMLLRLLFHVYFLKDHELNRSPAKFWKSFGVFGAVIASVSVLSFAFDIGQNCSGYFEWCLYGVLVFAVSFAALLLVSVIFFKKELRFIVNRFLRKKSK